MSDNNNYRNNHNYYDSFIDIYYNNARLELRILSWQTNFHFAFQIGRLEYLHISSYLKFVGVFLVVGLQIWGVGLLFIVCRLLASCDDNTRILFTSDLQFAVKVVNLGTTFCAPTALVVVKQVIL